VLTAFEGTDCTGRELGDGGSDNQPPGPFTLYFDVPDDLSKLRFSLLAKRRLTGEQYCQAYGGQLDQLSQIDAVHLAVSQTINTQGQLEVSAQISPTDYAYTASALYRGAGCVTRIDASSEPSWTKSFASSNSSERDLSVLLTDSTGRTYCQTFAAALAFPEDPEQLVPAIHAQVSDPDGIYNFMLYLTLTYPNGTPVSGADSSSEYRINVTTDASCSQPFYDQPLDMRDNPVPFYHIESDAPLYGYSLHLGPQSLTKSVCRRLR
jgi:hypothetical protein